MIISHVPKHAPRDEQGVLVVPTSFHTLPLPLLLQACHEQVSRFRRGVANDPQFCLELFRRALDAQDSEAWCGLLDLYQPLLRARLRQRGVAPDTAEEAVHEAFVALWLQSTRGAFSTANHTLPQVLNYLWGGVRFALIKLRRQQLDVLLDTDYQLRLEFSSTGGESAVERALDAQVLLARVRKLVTVQEWHVLWLRFGHEVPPREIALLLGMPVEEVYLNVASAKRRLRSDPQLRQFMEMENLL